MNDQTTKLIEQLASKLGTTSEYLWSVLIKQAPINSTIILIQLILIGVLGFVLWKLHKKFVKEDAYDSLDGFLYSSPMFIGLLIFLALVIYALLVGIPEMTAGFFNPEYWALNKIFYVL